MLYIFPLKNVAKPVFEAIVSSEFEDSCHKMLLWSCALDTSGAVSATPLRLFVTGVLKVSKNNCFAKRFFPVFFLFEKVCIPLWSAWLDNFSDVKISVLILGWNTAFKRFERAVTNVWSYSSVDFNLHASAPFSFFFLRFSINEIPADTAFSSVHFWIYGMKSFEMLSQIVLFATNVISLRNKTSHKEMIWSVIFVFLTAFHSFYSFSIWP